MGDIYKDYSYRIGEKWFTNKGDLATIIDYQSALNVSVEFLDSTVLSNLAYANIKKGAFKNKNTPCTYGVGFIGEGKYNMISFRKICDVWTRMLERSYGVKHKEKQPTYVGVTVCDEWHNFQNFAEWFEENYKEGFHLDKDIICPNCRVYSPETCAFVPIEINSLFTKREKCRGLYPIGVVKRKDKITNEFEASFTKKGKTFHIGYYSTPDEAFMAYKREKEKYIKEIAEEWKSRIDKKVYQSMIEYNVKIED